MSKHHFVPQFYLKRWADSQDGKIVIFKKVPNNRIVCDRHTPEYIAHEDDLYKDIEQKFFSPLDNDSSKILSNFETAKISSQVTKLDLCEKDHLIWAKFILGLIIRMPETVNFIKESFGKEGVGEDIALSEIPSIINNKRAILDLRKLKWIFARTNSKIPLVTSDSPLIFKPRNLSHPDCVILLPLGPFHFFLATAEDNFLRLEKDPKLMAGHINQMVVSQAVKYVYASSKEDIQIDFLMKHLKV